MNRYLLAYSSLIFQPEVAVAEWPIDEIVVEDATIDEAGRRRVAHHAQVGEVGERGPQVVDERHQVADLVEVHPECFQPGQEEVTVGEIIS